MSDNLGYLIWWKVGDVDLDHDQLAKSLAGTDIQLPARPLPMDVYRRVTGGQSLTAILDSGNLQLTLVPVESKSDKMLTHHMVGTLKSAAGEPKLVRKCGDVAFYYPPRGKNSKARMRVTAAPPLEDWAGPVNQYADLLRQDYEDGVKGRLDGQAMRRLVRAHLAKHQALYLDGPYFVRRLWHGPATVPLMPLFKALGEDSFMHSVPYPDGNTHRAFLVRGLERAVKKGDEVDEEIWKLVEE